MLDLKANDVVVELVNAGNLTIRLKFNIIGIPISKDLAHDLDLQAIENCRKILKSKNSALSFMNVEMYKDICEFKLQNCPKVEIDIVDNIKSSKTTNFLGYVNPNPPQGSRWISTTDNGTNSVMSLNSVANTVLNQDKDEDDQKNKKVV